MAIQVSGTQVIGNSRELTNIASVDATTVATLNAGGVGGGGFEPVAVTGTTPSLDVGTYNFFDNGTLTADTTISFASVPTNANWKYSFKPTIASGAWDISTASYLQNFSVASQETNPTDIFFKPDGTKMYVIGQTGDDVNEYDLSTAWDISTASYLQNFSVASQETTPSDIFFKPDGTKMYVIGYIGDDVNEYDLSTAWDISTASYLQDFSVAAQEATPQGIFFKPDGLKMYVIGYAGQDVNEYDLSTAWDVTSASYLQNFSVAAQETGPQGIFFKPDGLKMYVIGYTGKDVNEYDLSTAWDVSTASYLQNFSVSAQETSPSGIFFKPDGTKMYVIGYTGDDVNEYDLSTAWDVTSASYSQNFSVASQETNPIGIFFKPDGLKMYVIGSIGDDVNEYDLGTVTAITLPAAVVGTPNATERFTRVTYDFFTMDGGTTVNLIGEEII